MLLQDKDTVDWKRSMLHFIIVATLPGLRLLLRALRFVLGGLNLLRSHLPAQQDLELLT